MFERLLRVTGTVLVLAVAFVTPVLATSAPASADTVVDGCTIVSNPTPTNFTNCPGADLSSSNLSGVDLSFANLAGANLSAADLNGATLIAANLSNANLVPFPFQVAGFHNANLSSANLSGVSTAGCAPIPPDTAVCFGTDFSGANLTGANLINASLASCQTFTSPLGSFTGCGGAEFSGADLTGANFTGATLGSCLNGSCSGANFTGTLLVPSNQTVTATSSAGAVVTWPTPPSLPGATPGTCTPASGSTFPLGTTTVTCQVLDASSDVATGTFKVNVVPPPTTAVGLPSNGATITGGTFLDASASSPVGIASVSYEVSGGTLSDHVISGSTPTIVGYIGGWNTTTVPNGTYMLQSVATDVDGVSTTSDPVTITVNNPPPTTTVGLPSNGATLSGGTFLDASASPGVTSVNYELTGGTLSDQVISGSTPTIVGWLGGWNSTSVPDGTYTLQSVACYSGGVCGTSSGTTITVENAPVAYVTSDVTSGSSMSTVVTPIDTALNQAGTPITAGSVGNGTLLGHAIAITPNGQTAYVANADGGAGVTPINLATDTAGPNIPVGSGATCPTGIGSYAIAISPDGSTAYVASPFGCTTETGLVTAIDTATNTIKFSLPISSAVGDVSPTALAVTPNGGTVYVTSNEHQPGLPGIVTPIDPTTQSAGPPINVCNDTTDIVLSPDGTTAYITCGTSVDVLDIATNAVTATIAVSAATEAITPGGQTLYVTDPAADEVIPISTATNAVGTPIALSSQPEALAITPDGSKAYVVGSNAVTPIDLATASAGTPITVQGSASGGIAIH